jgi:hypothetical protein
MKNLYRQKPFTLFRDFSDKRLKNLFSKDAWNMLDKYQRLDLLQEVSNRRAEKLKMSYYPRVSFEKMAPATSGQYFDGRIFLNEEKYALDKVTLEGGKEIELKDANLDAYETLVHEHQHAFQEECLEGKVEVDPSYLEKLDANRGFLSREENHSLYIDPKSNYQVYRLQISERDAFRVSENETDSLIESLKEEGKLSLVENQESLKAYQKMRAINGQEALEKETSLIYGQKNPELVVDKSLLDLKNGRLDLGKMTKLERETLEATKNSYKLCLSENLEREAKIELEGQYKIKDLPKIETIEKNPIKEELENNQKNNMKIGGIL